MLVLRGRGLIKGTGRHDTTTTIKTSILLRLCHLVRQEKYFKIDAFSEHTSAEGKEKMTSFVFLSSHPKEMIDKKINMDSSMICSQSNLKLDTRNRWICQLLCFNSRLFVCKEIEMIQWQLTVAVLFLNHLMVKLQKNEILKNSSKFLHQKIC